MRKYRIGSRFYPSTLFKIATILIIVAIFASAICFSLVGTFTENTYSVTVTEKQVKRSGEDDKYLIFTRLDNEKVRVFENTDNLLRGKFNSSDIYAQIQPNSKYQFTTIGFRIPFFSSYENSFGTWDFY